ncbi:hypothetical protein BOTNAR_0030g00190 [Botryotinia narcissicola]|uniref:BTB domain-containing protein n=1 Tax=Botryotinia narcissicola TaxID=278944 RepID=A0A4Z1JGL7_9HELO|nr:hypothetical protein BOTNAR_0030g00190 [Botryotinia narcissicola]
MSSPSKSPLMTPEALNETVILYVGPKRKKYIVHKKILCDQSDFFNAGFNKAFEEAANGEMYLPEDNPATFADLIEYLYRATLPYTEKSGTSFLLKLYYLIISTHRAFLVNLGSASKGVKDAFGPYDFHVHGLDGICYRKAQGSKTMGNEKNDLSRPST